MAEKDSPGPSLELPSLFDRKKKRRSEATGEPAPTEGTPPPAAPAEPTPTSTAPAAAPATEPAARAEPVEAAPAARAEPVEATPAARAEPVEAAPAARTAPPAPAAEPAPTRRPAPQPGPRPAQPAQRTEPVQPVQPAQPARPGPADDTRTMPAASATGVRTTDTRPAPAATAPHPDPHVEPGPDGAAATEESESTGRRMPDLPDLGVAVAALVVGALVGLLGVVLTFLGLKGCELVTGTDSCGGPGLLVLVAILVAMVLGGAAMLRLFRVPDAGSVSFLGVGLLTVVVLVLLLDVLMSPVMIVVIPVLTAGCFALARWVTTQLGEDVMADR